MTAVAQLLETVGRHGCLVSLMGETVKLRASKPLPDPILAELRNRKSEVIEFLLEHNIESVPAEWLQGVVRLTGMASVRDWPPQAWDRLRASLPNFMQIWALRAFELGWGTLDLFGAHPIAPFARLDCQGLALALHNCSILAMTENIATIKFTSGTSLMRHQKWRPSLTGRLSPIWEL